ncbi:hypothetical protein EU78_03700 [Mycolicibacterium rufum]|nr:hypothetical protein EU78_03700 [Mycolicibacterium rufum]
MRASNPATDTSTTPQDQVEPETRRHPGTLVERVHQRIAARKEARAERRLAHAASAKRQTARTAESTAP